MPTAVGASSTSCHVAELEEFIKAADKNGDDVIDYSEFAAGLQCVLLVCESRTLVCKTAGSRVENRRRSKEGMTLILPEISPKKGAISFNDQEAVR